MVLAVPVAVRFLQRGNRELSRNMSSYLSLAAIAKADLLAEHTEAITVSVLGGRIHIQMLTHKKRKLVSLVLQKNTDVLPQCVWLGGGEGGVEAVRRRRACSSKAIIM